MTAFLCLVVAHLECPLIAQTLPVPKSSAMLPGLL
jgi:hypothetical protein